MGKIFIYSLSDPRTNQIRYIGKTNNLKQRYDNHISASTRSRTYKDNWIKQLIALSLRPILQVVEEVHSSTWREREKYWIGTLRQQGARLTNQLSGGDGPDNANQTAFKIGSIPWNKGVYGYTTRKKGHVVSIEVKEKISLSLKGRESLTKRKVKQLDNNMNIINEYTSVKEASKSTGILGIRNVVTGRAKTAGGFIWHY